jgi:hypothetical protein
MRLGEVLLCHLVGEDDRLAGGAHLDTDISDDLTGTDTSPACIDVQTKTRPHIHLSTPPSPIIALP